MSAKSEISDALEHYRRAFAARTTDRAPTADGAHAAGEAHAADGARAAGGAHAANAEPAAGRAPAADREPAAIRALRREAMDRFGELGFPTTRLEEWRYTNVSRIAKTAFEVTAAADEVSRAQLETLGIPDFGGPRLVFVDGRHAADLCDLRDGGSIVIDSFVNRIGQIENLETSELVHWGRLAEIKDDAFTAFNTAMAGDGAVIVVPKNRALTAPIHLLFLSTNAAAPRVSFPRVLVVAESGSQAIVLEDHLSLDLSQAGEARSQTLSNAVSEIVVEPNASLDLIVLQRGNASASQIARQSIRQARDTRFAIHTFNLGGALLRNDLEIRLMEEGAECTLRGLTLGDGDQLIDDHTEVDHAVPHCDSRQLYKGVLGGHGRGVFRGRVIVRPDAQKTNALQQNKNLLLSPSAEVDTKPQLEIHADDVKCSHGSSIGQLDPDALFFMRSRGLSIQEAQSLLTEGFAGEIAETLPPGAMGEWIRELVQDRLRELFSGENGS